MMGRTEERLHDATTALGSTLQPEDIHPLRLPDAAPRPRRGERAASRLLATRQWMPPLAAAAAMAAVIGLVVVTAHVLPDHRRTPGPSSRSASPLSPVSASAAVPRFLVTTTDGRAAVETSASGQRIAVIPHPAAIYAYEGVAAAAGDRTFFLAGVNTSGGSWKVEFFRVALSRDGRPGPVRQLAGPPLVMQMPVISGGWVNFQFAVSPDGRQLAFASGTPFPSGAGTSYGPGLPAPGVNERLIVQDVATGSRRSWSAWSTAEAVITQFSWGRAGQLGYNLAVANARLSGGVLVRKPAGAVVSAFLVLSTTARGSGLIGNSHLVTGTVLPRRGSTAGAQGVISPDGQRAYVHRPQGTGSGQLKEVSVVTGQTARVLLAGYQAALGDPMSIDSSGRYLLFPVRLRSPKVVNDQRAYVLAHLARLDLRTGRLVVTHIPVLAEINGAFDASW